MGIQTEQNSDLSTDTFVARVLYSFRALWGYSSILIMEDVGDRFMENVNRIHSLVHSIKWDVTQPLHAYRSIVMEGRPQSVK